MAIAAHAQAAASSSLKPLYWKRLGAAQFAPTSVWHTLHAAAQPALAPAAAAGGGRLPPPPPKLASFVARPIETSVLERHFGSKPPQTGSALSARATGAGAHGAHGAGGASLLEAKRALNIGIALRQLRIKPDGSLTSALLSLDESLLSADGCEMLLKVVPTADERETALALTPAEVGTLGEVERVFVEMARMPHLETRLNAIADIRRFGALVEEATRHARRAAAALRTLRESDGVRALLATVLEVGNALNAGSTQRGGALGFKLDSMLTTVLGARAARVRVCGGPSTGRLRTAAPCQLAQPSAPQAPYAALPHACLLAPCPLSALHSRGPHARCDHPAIHPRPRALRRTCRAQACGPTPTRG